jgi:TPP-dependent pyruvate/acetoin dehydrogenase alpha subunit
VLLFENLPRRFGHAATDRQAAYMTAEEITSSADNDPLSSKC